MSKLSSGERDRALLRLAPIFSVAEGRGELPMTSGPPGHNITYTVTFDECIYLNLFSCFCWRATHRQKLISEQLDLLQLSDNFHLKMSGQQIPWSVVPQTTDDRLDRHTYIHTYEQLITHNNSQAQG